MLLPIDAIEHLNSNVGSQFVQNMWIAMLVQTLSLQRKFLLDISKNVGKEVMLFTLELTHLGYFKCSHSESSGILQVWWWSVASAVNQNSEVLFGDLVSNSQFAIRLCGDLLHVQMLCKNTVALFIWNFLCTTKGMDSDAFLSVNIFLYLYHFFMFFYLQIDVWNVQHEYWWGPRKSGGTEIANGTD
jgi:hypothetical protein